MNSTQNITRKWDQTLAIVLIAFVLSHITKNKKKNFFLKKLIFMCGIDHTEFMTYINT